MQYKTIALELLKRHRGTYNQLRKNRAVLPAMEELAGRLKTSHEAWKNRLAETRPGSDPSQISSEALEFALKELEDSLLGRRQEEGDPLSLDAAMAFIRSRTTPE